MLSFRNAIGRKMGNNYSVFGLHITCAAPLSFPVIRLWSLISFSILVPSGTQLAMYFFFCKKANTVTFSETSLLTNPTFLCHQSFLLLVQSYLCLHLFRLENSLSFRSSNILVVCWMLSHIFPQNNKNCWISKEVLNQKVLLKPQLTGFCSKTVLVFLPNFVQSIFIHAFKIGKRWNF